MADPHHIAELDAFDRATVRTYRAGLSISALGLLLLAASEVWLVEPAPARWLVVVGAAASIANLHLYLKRIRAVIVYSGWVGALLLLAPWRTPLLDLAGHGFVFVSLSGFAMKEQFCFRIPFLRAVPLLLATALVPMWFGPQALASTLLGLAGALYAILAIAKWRMPLHFDIGDKSRYQV